MKNRTQSGKPHRAERFKIDATKQKILKFIHWILDSCKDKQTLLLLACVVVVMYCPVWGGYLLHAIFGWAWCSVVASAVLLFWAGPFTPFFPLCIAITLAIKRIIEKRRL